MKNFRIIFSIIAFFTCAFTILSCETGITIITQAKSAKKVSILFIDRSVSSFKGDEVAEKESTAIAKTLYASINQDGNEIWISNIYGKSEIISNRKQWIFDAPKLVTNGLSRREIASKQLEYEGILETYKKDFVNKIVDDIYTIPKDQNGTDIFGSIRHLNDIQRLYSKADIEAHFYSDMKHCGKNIRKIFCNGATTFSSYKEAEDLGAEDANVIEEHFNILSSPLKDIAKVTIHLPAHEIDHDEGFIFLPSYYEQLFYNLGISHVSFH